MMEIPVQETGISSVLYLHLDTITHETDKAIFKTLHEENIQEVNLNDIGQDPLPFLRENHQTYNELIKPGINSNTNDVVNQLPSVNTKIKTRNALQKSTIKKPNNTFKCPLCQKDFVKQTQYEFHMKKHQLPKQFQCQICLKAYNKEVNYKIHMVTHTSGGPECPICNRKFQRHASLKAHLLVHEVNESYSCLHCKAEFDKECDLYKHMDAHEGENIEVLPNEIPLNCAYCNYMFYDSDKYKEHLRLHIQAKRFVSGERTRAKRKTKLREYQHKCQSCPKSFPKLCLLERHCRVHTGEKPFVCPKCNRGFTQSGTLQIHLNSHEGKKPYQCMFCPAKFVQRGNLRVHLLKTHTVAAPGEKLYKCSHCTCVFKKISSLNGHVTRVHTARSKSEEQEILDVVAKLKELDRKISMQPTVRYDTKKDNNQNSMQRTEKSNITYVKIADNSINGNIRTYLLKQRTVGEHRWYICCFCNKEFKKPSDLIRHRRIHTREKPYQCPECGLYFAQKSTVTNHIATHRKNEFECASCKKKFGTTRSLNVHLKKHEENSQYFKCVESAKTFGTFEEISSHIELQKSTDTNLLLVESEQEHLVKQKQPMLGPLVETDHGIFSIAPRSNISNIRPFKCSFCNMAFSRRMHLERHEANHSNKRDFTCSICSKQFVSAQTLKDHIMYHIKPRTFSCTVCNKAFINASMLERHSFMHRSGRPFICPYCKKRFKAREHCQKHIARHKANINPVIAESVNPPNEGESVVMDNLINIYPQHEQLNEQEDLQGSPIITTQINQDEAPEIHIQENASWFYHINNIQFLANASVNGPVPQIKLPNSDMLLNEINEIQPTTSNYARTEQVASSPIANDLFSANALFNPVQAPLDNHTLEMANNDKEIQVDINDIICANRNHTENITNKIILDNVQISNEVAEKSDINYYILSNLLQATEPAVVEAVENLKNTKSRNEEVVFSPLRTKTANFDGEVDQIETTYAETGEQTISTTDDYDVVPSTSQTTSSSRVQCTRCNKQFSDRKRLNKHLASKHKEHVRNECDFCHKVFKKKSDKDRHLRTHTGEKPFSCPKCEKSFAIKSTLVSHLRTHNPCENKEFQCKVCNAYLSSKSSLKSHILGHNDKQPFFCEICNKKFKHKHHMAAHKQSHANRNNVPKMSAVNMLQSIAFETNNKINEEQQIIYQTGNEEIFSQENLFAQEIPIMVDNMNPVTITLAYNPSNLTMKHDETVMFSDKYTGSNDLSDQGPTTKEKKYQCDVCYKFYVSKSVLRKHQRALHGAYKCDKCSKAFNSLELLEKHYSVHYGHRPFNCTLCTNSFSKEADLKVHLKRMHTSDYK